MQESRAQVPREEVAATLAARHELGPEFEPALVESLAQRLETSIEARVEARLAQQQSPASLTDQEADSPAGMRLAIACVSLGVAIPITAIAGGEVGLVGVIVSWAGIVGVNLAFALPGVTRPGC